MKLNLSEVGINGDGTNMADTMYYDEYVEFMVAIVRIIKEETGVELAGFSAQNEPMFEEPYGSAILNPVNYAKVCGMLGKRLQAEGFKTKVINSEQVFTQSPTVGQFAAAVNQDPLGKLYTNVIGLHYPNATTALWAATWAACKPAPAKELWATECESHGNDWNSIMLQLQYMTIGMNNGCGAWTVWGYSNGTTGDENDPTVVSGMMGNSNNTSKHFWAFKNYAKFVKKGAVQLKSTSSNANVLSAAFKDDTTMTIVLVNMDTKLPNSIRLTGSAPATGWDAYRSSLNEKCEKVNPFKGGVLVLPPSSITTLVINTQINHAPTVDPVLDQSVSENFGSSVILTGIGCGDPVAQTISITATSSDTTILKTRILGYTSPSNKATLLFTPATNALGTVTVTVIIKDDGGRDNGGIDADTITINVTVKPSSLNDVSNKVTLYPNPAGEIVNLNIPSELSDSKLVIYNMTGQVVLEKKLVGETQIELPVSGLSSGAYIVNMVSDNTIAKIQFAKK
jgi:O-glycosyl hydrolase